MKNKRLLAILLVFIFLGGAAVSSAIVFRVEKISISFSEYGKTEYINTDTAIPGYYDSVNYIKGKNIIFQLDKELLVQSIESSDPRIRVMNIEAKIPNMVDIIVRERYPMYYFKYQDAESLVTYTAVLDAELRIVTDGDDFEQINDGRQAGEKLVDLSGQFTVTEDFKNFDINDSTKNNLVHFLPPESEDIYGAQMLIEMAQLFAGQNMYEDALIHLFEFIVLDYDVGGERMTLKLRSGRVSGEGIVSIEIRGIKDRFAEKLANAWTVFEEQPKVPCDITVETGADGKIYTYFKPKETTEEEA